MRFAIFTLVILLGFKANLSIAQQESLVKENYLNIQQEFNAYDNVHTSIRPFSQKEIQKIKNENDSSEIEFPLKDRILLKQALINRADGKYELNIKPVIALMGGSGFNDSTSSNLMLDLGAGIQLEAKAGKRWSSSIIMYAGNTSTPQYVNAFIRQHGSVPGMGVVKAANPRSVFYYYNQGNVQFDASKNFNFSLGQGQHFFGEGHRSVLLSDFASPNSYFKITSTVWKLKYTNLFTWMKDLSQPGENYFRQRDKFASIHYLSWNVGKRWNFAFYEAIIWKSNDTLVNRGIDVHYLNPVVIYRPVEYATGSSDKVQVGLNSSFKASKSVKFYGQFMLDEFLLKELRADVKKAVKPSDTTIVHGWWANKHAGQIGLYYFSAFGMDGLTLQAEANYARPFTYSHGSPVQAYTHLNMPLAHPMGSNFKEVLFFAHYQKQKHYTELCYQYAIYGTDPTGTNYGNNVDKSYNSRQSEYYNFIGQGIKNELHSIGLKYSYLLFPEANIRLEASIWNRNTFSRINGNNDLQCMIGIRSVLFNRYRDF